jgi:hypothetical protein
MRSLLVALACLAGCTLAACQKGVDPLDEHRAACRELESKKQLRAGLTIDECAKELKAAAEARDPARLAEEGVQRIAALVLAGKGSLDPGKKQELADAIVSVERLGKPAVPALNARLNGSQDLELRDAVAKALVTICALDCLKQEWSCIIPALLEGALPEQPFEARRDSIKSLTRCTGKELGEDPAAWRSWYSSVSAAPKAAK